MKDKNIAIVLDAMGGDNAPHVTVEGAVEATRISPIKVILVGDEKAIEKETNFKISGHKLDIYGFCPECQKTDSQEGRIE